MTDYRPVDCAVHSAYELLVMQRRRLQLGWRDEYGTSHSAIVTATDLVTRQGEEFLVVTGAGGLVEAIRLDRIIGYHHA